MSESLINAVDSGIIVLNQSGAVVLWNDWMEEISGINAQAAQGRQLKSLFAGLAGTTLLGAITDALRDPSLSARAFTQSLTPLLTQGATTETNAGRPSHHLTVKPLTIGGYEGQCLIQVDNHRNGNTSLGLLREKERLEVTLSSITDAVIITDELKQIEFLNAMAEQLCGWRAEDAIGLHLDKVLNMTLEPLANPSDPGYSENECDFPDAGLILMSASGTQYPIELSIADITGENGKSSGSVVVFRDISHSRRMEARLFWQANHDPLTGLENRIQFERRLQHLLATPGDGDKQHALLYLDLDQFKIINDTCGHAAGDELIRQLTSILKYKIRRTDTLARLGGDEFGILLPDCPLDDALRLANDMRKQVNGFRFSWEGELFAMSLSIGLMPFDNTTKDATRVMMSADTACITAKDEGRNRVHVFKRGDSEASRRHGEMQWVSRIQSALDNNRLTLYSQSIVPLNGKGDMPPHREVLVRLFAEDGSLIPPGNFIPAAERYNLMPAVDRWVVKAAFEYLAGHLAREGQDFFILNINLSGASFMEEGFLDFVMEQLDHYAVPREMICFEVTETSTIANLDEATRFISALRDAGCKFALDDFGSGLSSFGYLKRLPVDYLKVDGSFIKDILDDPIHCAMVEAINQVGHIMGIRTVAEFVEDEATMKHLGKLGIDYAQGYHIEKPAPLL